jgi:hypothetical protein
MMRLKVRGSEHGGTINAASLLGAVPPCILQKKDHEFSREGCLIVVVEG